MAALASSIGVLGYLMFHPLPNFGLAAMLRDAAVCYGLTLLGHTFIGLFGTPSLCGRIPIHVHEYYSLSSCIEFS